MIGPHGMRTLYAASLVTTELFRDTATTLQSHWRSSALGWRWKRLRRFCPLSWLAIAVPGGCQRETGSVGAPEHVGAVTVDSVVGPLRLQLGPGGRRPTFERADSILIHYHMHNPGPRDFAYIDDPRFYYFRVFGPDGMRLFPEVVSATDGGAGTERILLLPGESGVTHSVNLACMPYHPMTFQPLVRPPDPSWCEAAFEFERPGTYRVVGQRVPPPAFGADERTVTPAMRRAQGGDTLASHADTLIIEFRPRPWWRRWWSRGSRLQDQAAADTGAF